MQHIQEIDGRAEADGRWLLASAFETTAAADGAELLRRVRRQVQRSTVRRRTRALASAGAVAALAGSAAVAVTLTATVASAPSAFAAVTAAAARTSASSFRITVEATTWHPASRTGHGAAGIWSTPRRAHVTGEFDLSRGVGEESVTGPWRFQALFLGRDTYVHQNPGFPPVFGANGNPSKRWWRLPAQTPLLPTALAPTEEYIAGTPAGPAALLGLLKSATRVTDEGPASGRGWTGTKYGFSVNEGSNVSASGYVDVDSQDRVRRLVTTERWQSLTIPLTGSEDVTFSDFGALVSVSEPAADQVDRLTSPVAMSVAPW